MRLLSFFLKSLRKWWQGRLIFEKFFRFVDFERAEDAQNLCQEQIIEILGKEVRCLRSLYGPGVFGHLLDPPGNHPRGAIFPVVDSINQSSVDFDCKSVWSQILIGLLDSYRTVCCYGGGAKVTEHRGTIQHVIRSQLVILSPVISRWSVSPIRSPCRRFWAGRPFAAHPWEWNRWHPKARRRQRDRMCTRKPSSEEETRRRECVSFARFARKIASCYGESVSFSSEKRTNSRNSL